MKRFLVWALLCALFPTMWAQGGEVDPPLPYAYNHTIDLFLGPSKNLTSYNQLMDGGAARFGKNFDSESQLGMQLNLRYTEFVSRHWGIYTQFQISNYLMGDEMAIARLEEFENVSHGTFRDLTASDWYRWGATYAQMMTGATYRYDVSRWSFRARVGLGYRSHSNRGTPTLGYYDLRLVEGVVPEKTLYVYNVLEYAFDLCNSQGERIDHRVRGFAYGSSLQVTFTPRRHFFFSIEAGWTGTLGHVHQSVTRTSAVYEGYDHWPDQIKGYSQARLVQRARMGNFLDMNFGVGWNIGWNRNK